jgi:hypothetical protein
MPSIFGRSVGGAIAMRHREQSNMSRIEPGRELGSFCTFLVTLSYRIVLWSFVAGGF